MNNTEKAQAWFEPGSHRLRPVVLEGRFVRLLPMQPAHAPALAQAGSDPKIWTWYPFPPELNGEGFTKLVKEALNGWEAGKELPFVTTEKAGGRVVGSTRYLNVDALNRRLEIGWTWLHPSAQGTQVNPEAKYLMLQYAFETLGCNRVEFKTDSLNEKSRGALLKLGAVEEGTLRNHMTTSTGRLRHSVYFSIISEEWLSVKRKLEKRLGLKE